MNKLTGMMVKSPRTSEPSSPWSLFRSNGSLQRGEAQPQKGPAPLTVALAQSLEAALVELATKHLRTEGLFRVSAVIEDVKQLADTMSSGKADSRTFHDLDEHLLANAIKKALHQHEPLIPSSLYEDFLTPDPDYYALFQTVPRLNKRILSSLFAFFAMLIDESQHNRMDADAVARSIGEMLLRPPATEQMSDLEAVQNRLSATRSVFRFLLENRTTVLPADAVIRRFAETSQRPAKASAADQSVEQIPAVDNSFDDSDWGDAKPSRLLSNAHQQHQGSPGGEFFKQRNADVSLEDLHDENISEVDALEDLQPPKDNKDRPHSTSPDELDADNEISRITEGAAIPDDASSQRSPSPQSPPPPISVKARVATREEKNENLIVPLPVPLPLPIPSAAEHRRSEDEASLRKSEEPPTPGPALTQAESPKIGRGAARDELGSPDAAQHDLRLSDPQSPTAEAPAVKHTKPVPKLKQLISSGAKLEPQTPLDASQAAASPTRMTFSSAVLAMRASSKLRKTQERLSFNENFKPRPKTEFGNHAGVILEGWLEKKQTSSPGLWNRRYVVLYDDGNVRFYGKARKSAWGMLPLDVRNRIPLSMVSRVVSDARSHDGRLFDIICEWPADTEDGRVLFTGAGWERHKERDKGERKPGNVATKVFHLKAATSEERLLWVTMLEQSLKQAAGGVSTLRSSSSRPPLPPKSLSIGGYLGGRDNDGIDEKSDNESVRSDFELRPQTKHRSRRSFNFPFGGKRSGDAEDDVQSTGSASSELRASKSKTWTSALSFRNKSPDRFSH